ncbi:MAG: arylsulfatase, partial [Planctomycetaceae bacterium]|nr:arylsulfatase [Planctomycetaceae bacterium]
NGTYALRVGEWKLHRYDKQTARNVVVEQQLADTKVPQYQLFNLANDPAEKTDVAAQNPAVTQRLKQQLTRIIKQGSSRPGAELKRQD